jgi:hypothetical protein
MAGDPKTFSFRGVVLELKDGFYDYSKCKFVFHNPTAVKSQDGDLLGYAHVSRSGHKIIADISIDYSTPERLDLQTNQKLYAHATGLWSPGLIFHDLKSLAYAFPVKEVEILSVKLSDEPNPSNFIDFSPYAKD